MTTESFTCPECGATSYNPNDVREGYCGRCHNWTGTGHRDDDPREYGGRGASGLYWYHPPYGPTVITDRNPFMKPGRKQTRRRRWVGVARRLRRAIRS